MRLAAALFAGIRVVHPAPAAAVVGLSAVLGAVLLREAGRELDERWLATVAAVAGSQVFTGAMNDLVDRARDQAAGRIEKPLASGAIGPEAVAWIASGGLALQLAALLRLGALPLLLGVAATGSALAYNLWLSRTPASVVPYLVSFGILPLWIAAGVGVPLGRVVAAVPLVAPFAAAAHLANVVRDHDADRRTGSRSLPQLIGRRRAVWLAWLAAMGVGVVVGGATVLSGRAEPLPVALGLAGLAAVGQGAGSASRLWYGMLVAAVAWTAAWALGTG